MKQPPPTAKEIARAREIVTEPHLLDPIHAVMDGWRGQGWHTLEILWGILIGLKIAELRAEEKKKK